MKFLNVRIWLIVFGIFLLIGSLSGIGSVESEASKQWDGVDLTGRTLDTGSPSPSVSIHPHLLKHFRPHPLYTSEEIENV